MNRIGEASDDEYPMSQSLELCHEPGAQYRALTDTRSSVQDKGPVGQNLRADGIDLVLPPKKQTRISLGVVVQEFVWTRRDRDNWTIIPHRSLDSGVGPRGHFLVSFDDRADEHVS